MLTSVQLSARQAQPAPIVTLFDTRHIYSSQTFSEFYAIIGGKYAPNINKTVEFVARFTKLKIPTKDFHHNLQN